MRKTVLLFLLFIGTLSCVHGQTTHFSVQRQEGLKLPWGFGGLSMIDGALHGTSEGLILVGETATTSPTTGLITRFAPDTTLARLIPEASYVVRSKGDGFLYYTVSQKDITRLFVLRDTKGKFITEPVEPKGWNGDICHPAFSPDGRCVVFSSRSVNGLGGDDLWCSRRNGDEWERPVNLGSRINTRGNERNPVFYGRYLLFESNGHNAPDSSCSLYSVAFPNAESDDQLIFYPYSLQRLPEPVNSSADDRELALDRERGAGYWISSRDGQESLFLFEGRLDGTRYSGTVMTDKGNPLAGATVTVLSDGRVAAKAQTDASGRYSLYLQPGKPGSVIVESAGHYVYRDTLTAVPHSSDSLFSEVTYNVRLTPLPVGRPIVLDNLFGPAADVELTDQGRNLLMFVIQTLRENSSLRAELRLSSKVSDDAEFNNMLNEHRIRVLRDFVGYYIPSVARISFVNGNSKGDLSAGEKRGDSLKVTFLE